ncbi:2-dehydropantoate 2-reductase [Endozoicomonas sp. G2_1]|uniref:ketopantoate reductase family protein n=1 Tax=Endozoicomonas sp. G2_1 TaxID=2821091 RepID=UPI001ADA3B5C|nr:2-dehydropantoate 2-reductase [Endozoicomonas sp. G2_1]MBO9489248.1 2-dehydropantoate 2-reductase [Endozoicomonas sp. G2_1]
MNIVIVGAGAIGLFCYQQIAKSMAIKAKTKATAKDNVKLSLLTKSSLTDCNKGLPSHFEFTDLQGDTESIELSFADKTHLTNADILLICVKSYQVKTVTAEIHQAISNHSINKQCALVLCHNGMGCLEDIEQFKLANPIYTLLTTHGSLKLSANHIKHTGKGQFDLGLVKPADDLSDNSAAIQACQSITQQLPDLLGNCHWQANIVASQWRKLAINCVINPITAIDGVENGAIQQRQYRDKIKAIVVELVEVAHAQGQLFEPSALIETVNQVAIATAQNQSSMLCDVLAKRATEIDYINGYIARLGKQHQITTPVNDELCKQIKALEQTYL